MKKRLYKFEVIDINTKSTKLLPFVLVLGTVEAIALDRCEAQEKVKELALSMYDLNNFVFISPKCEDIPMPPYLKLISVT